MQGVGSQVWGLTYIARIGVQSGFGSVPLIGASGVVVRVRSVRVWVFSFGVHDVKGATSIAEICKWFRSGLVFKGPRPLYHSTLLRVIKKKKKKKRGTILNLLNPLVLDCHACLAT